MLDNVIALDDFNDKGLALTFEHLWNNEMPEDVNTVYIFAHGSERMLQFEDESDYNALTVDGLRSNGIEEVAGNLNDLFEKNGIQKLYI